MQDLNYEQFLIYLRKFQSEIQKQFNRELKILGISSTHVSIILLLSKNITGYTMTELSRLISVDNALMTRNIKELETIQYLYRDRENPSARKYQIRLTEKGFKVAKKIQKIMKTHQKEFLSDFTDEEQEKIGEVMLLFKRKFLLKIEKEEK